MKKLNQTGDTIVEVLLALAVLAGVIGVSYAVASRSLARAQQAQERVQATKLVEGQIEALKYLASSIESTHTALFNSLITDLDTATPPVSPQCLIVNSVTGVVSKVIYTDSQCKNSGLFNYYIAAYDTVSKIFTIKTEWPSFRSGNDNVTMYYKVQNQ